MDITTLTIRKAHEAIKNGTYSVRDLVGSCLKEIDAKNSDINAYLEIFPDIDEQIAYAEKMLENGTATLLTGIPIALKDNMLFSGHRMTSGSKILEGYVATYDAEVVRALKAQGVVFLGRTNMDEFAMGSSTESSAFGITKNPLDTSRVPGGSSGGSCAAVSMNGALASLGTDTGGSIRQPASFCNLVGMKPTYGAVSRAGIVSLASSFDQVGPIAKTVDDAEILFNAISTYDKNDATSVPFSIRETYTKKPLGKRLGIPRSFLKGEGIDPEVLEDFERSCEKLVREGYELVDISLDLIQYSLAVYYIIMPAEASSNLARYDGIRYGYSEQGNNLLETYFKSRGHGFGKEVRRRIILGTYVLSHGHADAFYSTAITVRNKIQAELEKAFETVDAIITPTSPFPPFKFGEKSKNPVSMYISDLFLAPANITGLPAISVPSGKTSENLPLGLHIMAPLFREDILFSVGKDFEK